MKKKPPRQVAEQPAALELSVYPHSDPAKRKQQHRSTKVPQLINTPGTSQQHTSDPPLEPTERQNDYTLYPTPPVSIRNDEKKEFHITDYVPPANEVERERLIQQGIHIVFKFSLLLYMYNSWT